MLSHSVHLGFQVILVMYIHHSLQCLALLTLSLLKELLFIYPYSPEIPLDLAQGFYQHLKYADLGVFTYLSFSKTILKNLLKQKL